MLNYTRMIMSSNEIGMIFSDKQLSQRLERTEGRANIDFVETRAKLDPELGAIWVEVGGAFAMFDGPESPLTQTFCLGIFEEATNDHLDEIETFFIDRDAPVFHEVSPMTDPSLMTLLSERGYRPIELTSVMYRELSLIEPITPRNREIVTRPIGENEADRWAAVSASGWATIDPALGDFLLDFGKIAARTRGGVPFLAELDGRAIAAGGFSVYDDVCILAGAATIPEARRLGAQIALLSARLKYASENGCSLAMMCALPGSQSQKNAQRNGFNIAYTRTKWQLMR